MAVDTELKTHAVAYAAAGFAVFPLHADKTPRTINGMKDATTDQAVVAAWWDRWPDALIGCRVPIGVVVIDVDPKHNGMATWKLLKDTHGPLPATRAHRSGRNDGGGHLWFRRPPGKLSVRNLNRWAKEHGTGEAAGKHSWVAGIDLLHHNHRYTILPPSPHPETGQPYRWVDGHELQADTTDVPAWLAELITEEPPPILAPAPRLPRDELDSIADWFSTTTGFADLLVPEGWTLIHGNGDNDGSLWRHPNATAPHSASVKNGCLFVYTSNTDFEPTSEGEPHGYTPFKAYATLAHRGNQSEAARAARRMKDGWNGNGTNTTDWTWVALTTGTGTHEPDEPDPPDTDNVTGLEPICWADFWKREQIADDWLLEPIIPRGRQIALWAQHKTGKSLLTIELAAALATGTPCFGTPAKPAIDIIYLDLEMTEDDLDDRLTSLGYGPHSDLDRLHYYLLPALPPLDTPAGAQALLKLVDRHHATLVVIDTMARVVAGEENSADTYRAYYRHTGLRLKAAGISVARLDHAGKNVDQGQRGSSAKGDDVDVIWQLKATDNGLELTRQASRVSWVPERVFLRRYDEPDLHHNILADTDWPAGTVALAQILDAEGVPIGAGRPTARRILSARGHKASSALLSKALKYRRQMWARPEDLVK